VYRLVVGAAPVGAQDGDVVAGVADVGVDQQVLALLADMGPDRLQQLARRLDVAADGADIGLDDAQCDLHGVLPESASPATSIGNAPPFAGDTGGEGHAVLGLTFSGDSVFNPRREYGQAGDG